MKNISLPLNQNVISDLKAGERVMLSGCMLTARDAAHKRFAQILSKGGKLPVNINGMTIYYTGPCPKKPNTVIGSCGPTTSGRMDAYTPLLLDAGLKGMIGKGPRSDSVISSVIKNSAVYFAAIGGAGALYSLCVKSAEVICFEELAAEAVYKITVKDFPVIVAVDSNGKSIY